MAPLIVGCVKCGKAKPAAEAHWAACTACGKAVGICHDCGRTMPNPKWLVDESLAWHVGVRHTREVQVRRHPSVHLPLAQGGVNANETP